MSENKTGHLITFEGPEGSGKSTQIARMAQRFRDVGFEVVLTREPGGTTIGESIRHLLQHDDAGMNMCPETELLLFAASRAQLVREVIIPSIRKGKIVLCDRYIDSTTVYQGLARKIKEESVSFINQFAIDTMIPDLTVLFDLTPEESMQRIQKRAPGQQDRIEKESFEFHKSVREGYLKLAHDNPERFIIVDGSDSIEEIHKHVWDALSAKFIQ